MDYVYDSGARFAFLFEIYVGPGRYPPGHLRGRWQKQRDAEEELAQVTSAWRNGSLVQELAAGENLHRASEGV